ncbi:hypothetical protein V6N13_144441 [Hibiscus sabdariffa]
MTISTADRHKLSFKQSFKDLLATAKIRFHRRLLLNSRSESESANNQANQKINLSEPELIVSLSPVDRKISKVVLIGHGCTLGIQAVQIQDDVHAGFIPV